MYVGNAELRQIQIQNQEYHFYQVDAMKILLWLTLHYIIIIIKISVFKIIINNIQTRKESFWFNILLNINFKRRKNFFSSQNIENFTHLSFLS